MHLPQLQAVAHAIEAELPRDDEPA